VVAVLDALGVAAAAVAGLHLGGVVAAEVAAAFPARVSKVILLGPILFDAAGRAERTPFFERHMQQPKLWTLAPDGSHLTAIWARFARYTSSVPLLHRLVLDMLRAGPLTQDEFPVLLYRQEDRLPLLSCPALLVYWRDDIFATPARAAPLREAFRPGSEVVLEGGAYGVHEDAPALARAILAYLM
jgi:pimeloyl-ACP methyl ester carboxylesterase